MAQLGCSTGAGRKRRQFTDLFARHAGSPPFEKICSHGALSPCSKRPDRAGRLQFEIGGEGRNRTHLGSCEPTTVLKTARTTRHPSLSKKRKPERLFELFDRLNDFVEVGPVTGIEFGMEQFAIGVNLESAAARRNERERFDAFAEFKNFGRQTDGLRRVVSNDAIFD